MGKVRFRNAKWSLKTTSTLLGALLCVRTIYMRGVEAD